MSLVQAGASQAAGIVAEFIDTYDRTIQESDARLDMGMRRDVPSTRRTNIYAYFESAPHAVRWVRGQSRPKAAFRSIQYEVENLDWGRAVPWHNNDLQDDQIGNMLDRARELGASFGILDERVFFQIVTAAADNDLLPAVPNAPDGVALHNGAARFGHASGNIVTGTGVANPNAIVNDLFLAITRARGFQDTEGQPLHPAQNLETEILVVYNTVNEKVFREAFEQKVQQSASGNAGVTPLVIDARFGVTHWPTQRLTDNDWYVFFGRVNPKPVFSQLRQAPLERIRTMDSGSDQAIDTKIEEVGFDGRKGFGVNAAYGTVKVDNA